jgi:hypothetical protein
LLSAKQIAPGQSGEIEVSIKTEGLSAISKSVSVTSNDPRQPQLVLTLIAAVEPEFQLSERSIYFGNNPRGKEVTRELIVTIPPDKNAKLVSVESTDQAVTARLELMPGAEGKKYKITAVQKEDSKDGYHYGMIMVKTTSRLNPDLKIPVRGMVVPPSSPNN